MQKTVGKAAVKSPTDHFVGYSQRLSDILLGFDWAPVVQLAEDLRECWRTGHQVFLCGNGGSAGNASHLANDFLYPLSKTKGSGIRVHALVHGPVQVVCCTNIKLPKIFCFPRREGVWIDGLDVRIGK